MQHRLQRRQMTIPLSFEDNIHRYKACLATCKPCDIAVTELIGTGLAIQQVSDGAAGRYTLVHIESGMLLSAGAVSTIVEAGRWIRAVAPLCDWTQPANTLQPPPGVSAKGLAEQVERAHLDALSETCLHQSVATGDV